MGKVVDASQGHQQVRDEKAAAMRVTRDSF
jgi:hypothetical protein